jgi:hypothetical protein
MPVAINYGTGFSSAWSNVATFVPKFVVFLIILIVGWLIAKVITKVLSAVLTRVGFDKAVERGGIKKALESSKYDASDILAKIVYYALMLFVLSTAFGVFGNNPVSSYLHAVVAYLPLVFVAIVIVIIASAIAAAAKALIENSLSGVSYAKVLGNVVSGLSQFLDAAGLWVIEVLLVKDDPGDAPMTTEAFEPSPVRSMLHVVSDGEQGSAVPPPDRRVHRCVSLRDRAWRSSGRHVSRISPSGP